MFAHPYLIIYLFSTSTQDLAFVVGGGFSCWLISAMLPNGFESIVSVNPHFSSFPQLRLLSIGFGPLEGGGASLSSGELGLCPPETGDTSLSALRLFGRQRSWLPA